MPKPDSGDAGERKLAQTDVQTTPKVAGESITGEAMAVAYEPHFKSFSGSGDNRLSAAGKSVSEFCIEDKESGKLITAEGERPASEPRPSFLLGLKQALQGDHSPEETARLQAEFSISYMTRKASEFVRQTAENLMDGIQHCFGSKDQLLKTDPITGEQTVTIGKHTYPATDIVAQNPSQQSDAHSPSAGAPVNFIFKLGEFLKVKPAKDYVESWDRSGSVHPIPSVGKAVLETYKSVLNDPRRNIGEFNFAIGEKDGKLYESSLWYNPGFKFGEFEMQETVGVTELKDHGMRVTDFGHSHPYRKGMGYDIFSEPDLTTAHKLDGDIHVGPFSGSGTFKEFLLTPAPDNKLLLYCADFNDKASNHPAAEKEGRIVELGRFSGTGQFVPDEKQSKLLKELGFIE